MLWQSTKKESDILNMWRDLRIKYGKEFINYWNEDDFLKIDQMSHESIEVINAAKEVNRLTQEIRTFPFPTDFGIAPI